MVPHSVSERDMLVLLAQIGHADFDVVDIPVRCRYGFPVVVKCLPFNSSGQLLPTFLWLTCPYLRRVLARLEASGIAGRLQEWVERVPAVKKKFREQNLQYIQKRKELLPSTEAAVEERAVKLSIAGCPRLEEIKCIHAQLACWLGGIENLVGRALARLLSLKLPVDCGGRFKRCFAAKGLSESRQRPS